MIKLKDILLENVARYYVDAVLVTDRSTNFTDIVDGIRGVRKITTVNVNTSEDLEEKNKNRTDGKEVHTITIKFLGGLEPTQDLKFFKTTMLQSKKGDENKRIDGLKHIIFKEKSLTRA